MADLTMYPPALDAVFDLLQPHWVCLFATLNPLAEPTDPWYAPQPIGDGARYTFAFVHEAAVAAWGLAGRDGVPIASAALPRLALSPRLLVGARGTITLDFAEDCSFLHWYKRRAGARG